MSTSWHANEQPVELQVFIYNCVIASSFVILYYDYVLTFSKEYTLYWSKQHRTFTFASALFFMNRYITILGHVPVLFLYLGNWPHMDRLEVCLWINHYNEYLIVVIQVIIGVMSILRTYLLYSRNRKILVILCSVTVGSIIYGMVSIVRLHETPYTLNDLPPAGCLLPVTSPMARGLAQAWAAHLFFDTLVFGLTLYQSFQTKDLGFARVVHVIMRDGAMYFGIIILASISVIVSFYVLPSYIRGLTATTTNTISSSMMSRLMLNLRALDKKEDVPPMLSNLVFAKSSTGTFDDDNWSYSDGYEENGTTFHNPVHQGNGKTFTLRLSGLNCNDDCTRDVLKAMGLDVREIV